MKFLTITALVLAFALPVIAEEVLLNSGAEIDGEIVKVDHTGITVKAGDKTIDVTPGDLDPHYYYSQWSKRIKKDPEQHLRLAVYAFEHGMFNQARSQYRKAERLDKEMVKKFEEEVVPEIKEGIAEKLLAQARVAIDKGDYKTGEQIVAKILTRLEDTQAAAQARNVLASIHLWELDKDQERLVKRLAKHLPKDEAEALKVQDRVVGKVAPIERRLESARRLVTKGLQTKTSNRQKGIFQQAAKKFEGVIKSTDKLIADAGDDDALVEYLMELRDIATREGVDAWVHAGGVLVIRSSFNDALEMANRALALDPENAQAKKFYQEVQRAAAMNSGWWGVGRRRR